MRYFDFHRRRLASKNHISGVPSTVSGTESVMLNATSGSKISALEIEGNTYQETEETSPIIEQAISSDGFTSTGEKYIAYYITSEQLTALQEWATDKGYTGNFKLSVSAEDTSEIPTGFAVVAGNSLDDILVGSNTTTIYYNSPYGESKGAVTVNLSDTVYVGIGNTVEGVGENASEYLDLFLSNFTFCLQPTEYKGIPSTENPSAVKNSNDSGMKIELKSINLVYMIMPTITKSGITFTNNGDGTITVDGTATAKSVFYFCGGVSTTGKLILLGCPSGGSYHSYNLEVKCYDNEGERYYLADIGNGYISTKQISKFTDVYVVIEKGQTVSNLTFKPQLYDLTAIYGEGNEPTTVEEFLNDYPDYEPYFNKTVSIPSNVTLSDGASLSINLAKVGDKADKLSVKGSRAIYSQSTEKITLTGEESGWSDADGVYKYSFDKPLIENVGYCTHFKLSTMGEENTFGVESDGVTFKTDASGSLESFKAWLKAKSDAGNAVLVTVALASPVEYDVTKTDFAKELLNLETSRGYSLTLKAEADIAPSTLVCEYYSLENEDKQTVAVRCEKADGTPLCEPYLHEVRKNTLYMVKAPEIDGYVSDKESESADASITTEIKFTYTEAEK